MYPNRFEQNRDSPVKEGDELDVVIEAVGEKGDGIAKKQGFVLFVPNTKQGETCRIRVSRVLRSVGFADKIGEAKGAPKAEPAPQEREPDFDPEEHKDTTDFGDEDDADQDDSDEEELDAEEEKD